ncbi:MAG: Sir2 silent information regulator family NAD-dependent deacetylase, partial [Streptococcus sp.]|nr:Sir2 silent information regulator family NAD-dependent deacetylase [Streptococcus sp.]
MKQEKIDKAKKLLAEADAIVIGAGAGLSSAAGLTYSGQRFEEHFAPFIKAYGLTDMYSAGFYPFATEEKKWGY